MQNKAKYFFLALIVLIADQVSKAWATDKLLPVDTLEVVLEGVPLDIFSELHNGEEENLQLQ